MAVRLPRLSRTSPRLFKLGAVAAIFTLVSVGWSIQWRAKTWVASEVPVAFWAWRNQAPSRFDIQNAIQKASARTLFLRAGQFDYQKGTLRRIRPATGELPRGIELHLVYNGTRSLLADLEKIQESTLATSIAEAYRLDSERADLDHAVVAGLQVDLDVPTRLLPRYARALRALRQRLKAGTQLSITGLPTWMTSPALSQVLAETDFWIPQCYGAVIPERMDQIVPISSPTSVANAVARAREFNHPFYAGLAAYNHVILYNSNGDLVSLRGDMDPAQISDAPNLELIERRSFDQGEEIGGSDSSMSEWRYVFRARTAGVTDDLAFKEGDFLVLDSPSTGSLQESARMVRELAGKKLLGICVFRLPGVDDAATLTIEQIAAALSEGGQVIKADINLAVLHETAAQRETRHGSRNPVLRLTAANTGTVNSILGAALIVDLSVPAGKAHVISVDGFRSVETLCGTSDRNSRSLPQPCSERLANILRFRAGTFAPGKRAQALLVFGKDPPQTLQAHIQMETEEGHYVCSHEIVVKGGATQ